MLRNSGDQLSFFDPDASLFAFFKALVRYGLSKSVLVFYYFRLLLYGIQLLISNLKFQIIRRLIWGGGRLGQPVAHAGVLAMSVAIFMVGGVFSGSGVVRGQTVVATHASPLQDVLSAQTSTATKPPEDRPRDEVFEYEVQPGDTLSTIGEKFQISVETIRYANDLADVDDLSPGQKLVILPVSGVQHTVKEGDTVESIANKYKVSPQAVVDFNYLNEPFALNMGDSLMVPDATIPQPVPPTLPIPPYAYGSGETYTGSVSPGTGLFRWPTDARLITQYFSYWHPAIDIGQYSSIYAADAGTVVFAGWSPVGYGYLVEVDHGNGYKTGYAHLSRIDVSVGQTVGKGQVVGLMGATGRAWGVHLHFMVWENGRFINPLSVL
jgi:murein DD-endopeptidase MepM/ murein hydrolase activator NlpD